MFDFTYTKRQPALKEFHEEFVQHQIPKIITVYQCFKKILRTVSFTRAGDDKYIIPRFVSCIKNEEINLAWAVHKISQRG